jgi:hypothetical protein
MYHERDYNIVSGGEAAWTTAGSGVAGAHRLLGCEWQGGGGSRSWHSSCSYPSLLYLKEKLFPLLALSPTRCGHGRSLGARPVGGWVGSAVRPGSGEIHGRLT